MDNLYPVFLQLVGVPCLVIGGGSVATRKIRPLLAAQAIVTVVSPTLTPELRAHAESGALRWIARPYQPGDLKNQVCRLVFAATDNRQVNRQVYEEALRLNVWVNVADRPEECTLMNPARVQQGPVDIAISTHGRSPALAKALREALQADLQDDGNRFLRLWRQVSSSD